MGGGDGTSVGGGLGALMGSPGYVLVTMGQGPPSIGEPRGMRHGLPGLGGLSGALSSLGGLGSGGPSIHRNSSPAALSISGAPTPPPPPSNSFGWSSGMPPPLPPPSHSMRPTHGHATAHWRRNGSLQNRQQRLLGNGFASGGFSHQLYSGPRNGAGSNNRASFQRGTTFRPARTSRSSGHGYPIGSGGSGRAPDGSYPSSVPYGGHRHNGQSSSTAVLARLSHGLHLAHAGHSNNGNGEEESMQQWGRRIHRL